MNTVGIAGAFTIGLVSGLWLAAIWLRPRGVEPHDLGTGEETL